MLHLSLYTFGSCYLFLVRCFIVSDFWFQVNFVQLWNPHCANAFCSHTRIFKLTEINEWSVFALYQILYVSFHQKYYCTNVLEHRIAFDIISLYWQLTIRESTSIRYEKTNIYCTCFQPSHEHTVVRQYTEVQWWPNIARLEAAKDIFTVLFKFYVKKLDSSKTEVPVSHFAPHKAFVFHIFLDNCRSKCQLRKLPHKIYIPLNQLERYRVILCSRWKQCSKTCSSLPPQSQVGLNALNVLYR